ncbi:MAG TPA: ABC transporter ATP-binding protein [Paracoccaceae bacterium]|nr:ABC transporter ATP-binding protein [Paracoccaceae bacterium]
MSRVTIDRLSKRFGGKPPTIAANELQLEIGEGEFLVLLGPSGCGKTTTLRCLAGLEAPDAGRITLGGRTVFDSARGINLPPDRRNVGMVFQSYALWPHMTVRKNVEYPLRARGLKQGLAQRWVEETIRLVECEALIDRYPGQLSGGQQQRIALARGIVARPELVLFDEPLSNLDARLRDQVRSQLHELHARLGFTAVFVTHDQVEALALGQRLAVMRSGTIEQLDTPQNVFERPATEYVAAFIGMSNRLVLEFEEGAWRCDGVAAEGAPDVAGDKAAWLAAHFRPEDLHVAAPGWSLPAETLALPATVVDSAFAGRHFDVVVAVGQQRFQGRLASDGSDGLAGPLGAGAAVKVWFQAGMAAYYGADGAAIGRRRGPVLRRA